MPYVNEEGGRLNNYAKEPEIYKAEPPSGSDKRNFLILGTIGGLLLVGVMAIAVVVS
ncbi:MAG: ssl1498 family light-harvesting-like protein [Cyanobacteria bacterium P01_F01_bin.153]